MIDAALAAQNAVVALESLGLGTCYIGAIRNDPETVARELALPEGVFPVFGLTVGFPDPSAARRSETTAAAIDRPAPRAICQAKQRTPGSCHL